ncbi:Cof-type HAD-IIB family hydrolase [Paenibacillus sp. 1001270B_150601_E10]|uniref:Cof-type HAD-IIB family hydrolase n=1 Tax=Paenibacillus sp. 1001270B_150601_E10 TaxID=2787079 RepID=UPI0018A099EC|nr:Cof-type HAD-IIB family hydrolase [Paenibacillus sp. 1001270B_150601_E10]
MSRYALLALDMDGTLLDDEQRVSDENREAIQEAQRAGVTVILSTGRGFVNAVPYADELGLTGPMVTVNGGEVWKTPHDLHVRHLLERNQVQRMYEITRKYDTWFWAYSTKGIYNRDKWTAVIEEEDWLKFGYYNEDDDIRGKILDELHTIGGLELTNSSPYNIEINPLGIHKATGVQTVCDLLGLNMSQVVSVGDSLNDLAVIQQSGLGAAMGNAQDRVKEAANIVVATNNEHGVAELIRKYIL